MSSQLILERFLPLTRLNMFTREERREETSSGCFCLVFFVFLFLFPFLGFFLKVKQIDYCRDS